MSKSMESKQKKTKTFFPDDWLPGEVIEAAEEAFFKGKIDNVSQQIIYTTKSGVEVCLNLKAGKITSWFPKC